MSKLCDPMDCSTPRYTVLQYLPKLLKFMCIVSVMLSNYLILCCTFLLLPSIFPSIRVFTMSRLFASGGQSIGASASASSEYSWLILLGLTGLSSLQSKGLSRALSSTTVQRHQFFSIQPYLCSNSHTTHDNWKNHSFHYTDLCQQSDVSAF